MVDKSKDSHREIDRAMCLWKEWLETRSKLIWTAVQRTWMPTLFLIPLTLSLLFFSCCRRWFFAHCYSDFRGHCYCESFPVYVMLLLHSYSVPGVWAQVNFDPLLLLLPSSLSCLSFVFCVFHSLFRFLIFSSGRLLGSFLLFPRSSLLILSASEWDPILASRRSLTTRRTSKTRTTKRKAQFANQVFMQWLTSERSEGKGCLIRLLMLNCIALNRMPKHSWDDDPNAAAGSVSATEQEEAVEKKIASLCLGISILTSLSICLFAFYEWFCEWLQTEYQEGEREKCSRRKIVRDVREKS